MSLEAKNEPPDYLISEIDVKKSEVFEKEVIPKAWISKEGSGG